MKTITTLRTLIKAGIILALLTNILNIDLSAQAACVAPPPNLTSWWSGEGNANDSIGTNFGTVVGDVTFVPAQVGLGLSFNAPLAGFSVADSPELNFGAGVDFSIEAWIKPTAVTTSYGVMNVLDKRTVLSDSQAMGYEVYLNNGKLAFEISDSLNKPYLLAGLVGPDLRDGSWHHIAVTVQRAMTTGGNLYVDGQVVATFDPTPYQGDLTVGQPLLIGLHPSYPRLNCNYSGAMDEIALYRRALSGAEVQALYSAGAAGKCTTPIAPFIVSQATNQTLAVGSGVTLKVVAGGTAPLSYQWLFRGAELANDVRFSGMNSNALTLSNLVAGDSGDYSVIVSNTQGVVTGAIATLTVILPPSISEAPLNQTVVAGASVSFSVTASGAPPLTYQWQKNGTSLPGATQTSLLLSNVQPSNAGNYTVVVANPAASTTSAVATLKVVLPPTIKTQPQSQTLVAGGTAVFSVTASGTLPLAYQWQFNALDIAGATNATLLLTNVQFAHAGNYAVIVSNIAGSLTSSNATLTVNAQPSCIAPPANLISWWSGEGNANDRVGTNFGNVVGDITFVPAQVGLGLSFNATLAGLTVSNSPELNFGAGVDFSIEAWIKPAAVTTSYGVMNVLDKRTVLSDSQAMGYEVYLSNGKLAFEICDSLNKPYLLAGLVGPDMRDGSWHHIAVTIQRALTTGGKLYVDGQVVATFNPTSHQGDLTTPEPLLIGLHPSYPRINCNYRGAMDEITLYRRALSGGEVQGLYSAGAAGKCTTPVTPFIGSQPTNQTVVAGANVTLNVVAGGTAPLSYQWLFNGAALLSATNANLSLTNIQFSQAGAYSVTITNVAGSVTSIAAQVSVTFPPAAVQVGNASALDGSTITVPLTLKANGNENALGLSLNFDPALLSYSGVSLGRGAAEASLLVNPSQAGVGKLGLAVALPPDGSFAPGDQEVLLVSFLTAVVTNATTATLSFGDQPVARQLSDAPGNPLVATYTGGSIAIAAVEFEGDVSPRPSGNRAVTITDWVMVGRYAARLDYPTNAVEFQRADCAPRSALGDGAIKVTDWVQAGRYAAGLDPLTPAGGPDAEITPTNAPAKAAALKGASGRFSISRQLRASSSTLVPGQPGTVSILLEAQGNENALGFSLAFDPSLLSFTGATLGSGASGATLNLNASQAASGRLGVALALGTGSSFAAGTKEVLKISFRATASAAAGSATLLFLDQPVPRELADLNALPLLADYASAQMTIYPLPALQILRSEQSLTLSWPLWASNFALQELSGTWALPTWTNSTAAVNISNNQSVITVPTKGQNKFYRLRGQ